jgi:hypothetical protein
MLNIKDLSQPEFLKQDHYEQALKIGLEIFGRKDPARQAFDVGGRYEDGRVVIPYLDREIELDVEALRFSIRPGGDEAPTWLSILAVHYLNNAPGKRPTGELKHFRQFKEGQFYEPAFNSRTKEILIQVFGNNPAPMIAAGRRLRGKILDNGDAAVELSYFPYLPITCIVWKGDEEFPAEATVLFDETAEVYLGAEDMAVAGQMAVLELIRAARD